MSATIYLHWTATPYNWVRSGLYHSIIGGDGQVHRLHSYGADLPAHTWRRNTNAVALSCACMGGRPDPWSIPPAKPQLEALCQEAAAVARSWGGTGERWDLLQLEKGGPPTGGEQLRERVRQLLSVEVASGPAPLQFRRADSMEARGLPLATEIDVNGSSWALATALLERYELPFQWDASNRRILVGALDVVPRSQDDAVQASVGWPLFEMTLERSTAPVILRGIVRQDRAWCRVLEFAEELGISAAYDPFRLLERRGG